MTKCDFSREEPPEFDLEAGSTLAVLRGPEGLFELDIHEELTECSWSSERLCWLPSSHPLMVAWRSLSAVREINRDVLDAVCLILSETVLDPDADRPTLPTLAVGPPPAPPKPTAANPRAFKGTKARPPKTRRPEPMDLRPFLCTPVGQDRLVSLLASALGDIEVPREARDAPVDFRRYFAWRHREDGLPMDFYWSLGLDRRRSRCRDVACLFAKYGWERGLAWSRLIAEIDPSVCLDVLRWLMKQKNPTDLSDEICAAFRTVAGAITEEIEFEERCEIFDGVLGGRDPQALLIGIDISRKYEHGAIRANRIPSRRDAESVFRFAQATPSLGVWTHLHLWGDCAVLSGLGGMLERLPFGDIEEPATDSLLMVFRSFGEGWDGYSVGDWDSFRADLEDYVKLVAETPKPYQVKAVRFLHECLDEKTLQTSLPVLGHFVRRLCREPMSSDGRIDYVVEVLARLDRQSVEKILDLPDAVFRRLDQSCRRVNDSWLISVGLLTMFRVGVGELLIDGLAHHPRGLCGAAKVLGSHSHVVRRELISDLVSSPLWIDVHSQDAAALVELFDKHGTKGGVQPVSRRLREHLAGKIDLRPGQIDRHTKKLRDAWSAVLCDALRELASKRLHEGFVGVEVSGDLSDKELHALMLQRGSEENRRAYRRFLRACFDGDTSYLVRHPENSSWLEALPSARRDVWTRGMAISVESSSHGNVRLEIESDPLEALRMGTHVGSCFGLGGRFAYSAVAVVMDANKQVVFARDGQGRFLARQILALTDKGKLACFSVYPDSEEELKEAFREFDRELASRLGVEITNDDDEAIALLAAFSWWHDGLWSEDGKRNSTSGAGPSVCRPPGAIGRPR